MRIAFVGKGGSGKTTLSALFSHFISKKYLVLAIDADINMHMGQLLGFSKPLPVEKHLSHPESVKNIKTYLKGRNERIKELAHFRKTTPPTAKSNFVTLHNSKDHIISTFGMRNGTLAFLTVGTYDAEEVGVSCYHNNLAILENILSHLIDAKGIAVVDMVAGIDAFANTLHAQFDMLVLCVEPTERGVEVFRQYEKLGRSAGVYDSLCVVGNKIRQEEDLEFLRKRIPAEKLLGFFRESEYLRRKDREGGALRIDELEEENINILKIIEEKLFSKNPDYQARLQKLFELHRSYIAQAFIAERFGDLTNQIDLDFNIELFIKNYGG